MKASESDDTYHIFRETVGAPLFKVMRQLSGRSERIYQVMRSAWLPPIVAGDSDTLTVETLHSLDRGKLQLLLSQRFTPDVWNNFVRPLVHRPGRSVFYAPVDTDGTFQMAMRERVIEAFNTTSPGDFISFAEKLYALESGKTDLSAFVAETYSTFRNFFSALHAVHQEVAYARQTNTPTPAHALMDARVTEEFPAEWLSYRPMDSQSARQVVKLLAFESGAGRDMAGLRSNFDTAEHELNARVLELSEIEEKFASLTGRALRAALNTEAEKRGGAGYLTILETAERNMRTVRQMRDHFDALLKAQSGVPIEVRPFVAILHTLASLTVQEPGTALVDTISMIEQPLRHYGFGTEALKQIAASGKSAASEAIATLMQAFGKSVQLNAENARLRTFFGFVDTDSTLTLKEKIHPILNQDTASHPWLAPAVKLARVAKTLASTGIGRADTDVRRATL